MHRALVACLAVGAVVVAALAVALPASGTTTGASWTYAGVVQRSRDIERESVDISCPSATRCWSLGSGRLVTSTDGGATWTNRDALLPADVGHLGGIACVSEVRCYGGAGTEPSGGAVLVVDRGTLTVSALPASVRGIVAIACPGARRCIASDGTRSVTTTDGGASWSTQQFPGVVPDFDVLSCAPGTDSCWALSLTSVLHSDDLGRTWTTVQLPAYVDDLETVACPSATVCEFTVAAGDQFQPTALRTTDGGRTFRRSLLPARGSWDALSCTSTTHCVTAEVGGATGNRILGAATTDGTTWTALDVPNVPSGAGAGVSCASDSRCVFVGNGVAIVTTDGGATWAVHDTPVGLHLVETDLTACPSPTVCVTVGPDVLGHPRDAVTADGGRTWTQHPFPAGAGTVDDLSCPSVSHCLAVGTGAAPNRVLQAFVSDNGGRSWRAGPVSGDGTLSELDCRDAGFCVAVGHLRGSGVARVTHDGGLTWSAAPVPAGAGAPTALSCTASGCVLFGSTSVGDARVWTSDAEATTWTPRGLPDIGSTRYLADVDCVAARCVAVGSHGVSSSQDEYDLVLTSADHGRTWTARPDVLGLGSASLTRVSCPSAQACAATIQQTYLQPPLVVTTTDAGATWTYHLLDAPAQYDQPRDVSCSATRCLVTALGSLAEVIAVRGVLAPTQGTIASIAR